MFTIWAIKTYAFITSIKFIIHFHYYDRNHIFANFQNLKYLAWGLMCLSHLLERARNLKYEERQIQNEFKFHL
jgi:hypothetical protein